MVPLASSIESRNEHPIRDAVTERGSMPMSKNKKILMMLTKGGMSQADIASALHASKRDVSAGARAIREYGLTFDAVSEMDVDAIDDLFFPKKGRRPSDVYLQQDAYYIDFSAPFHALSVHRSVVHRYMRMRASVQANRFTRTDGNAFVVLKSCSSYD